MSGKSLSGVAIASALLVLSSSSNAQISPSTASPRDTRPSIPLGTPRLGAAPLDTAALNTLKWRELGPFRGGRSVAVEGSSARPNEYYMGTTGGGVFKTLDGGQSWAPVTDKYFGGTIGAVTVAPSNPDVVYVGGGEYPIRGNVSHGDGVWKSTDAGKTWTSLGLDATRHIARVRVHPTNPDLVYVAAQGNVWTPTPERGIYRSKDGGKSWAKILFRNDSTGASDLVMDPSNPSVLYATFWQAGRTPWILVSGGPGSAIFKTGVSERPRVADSRRIAKARFAVPATRTMDAAPAFPIRPVAVNGGDSGLSFSDSRSKQGWGSRAMGKGWAIPMNSSDFPSSMVFSLKFQPRRESLAPWFRSTASGVAKSRNSPVVRVNR